MPYQDPTQFPDYESWIAATKPEPTDFADYGRTSPFTLDTVSAEGYPSRAWYEHRKSDVYLSGRDENKDTAQRWTLHLRIDNVDTHEDVPVEAVDLLLTLIRLTGCEALNGIDCGGDSFREWCEAYYGEDEDPGTMGRALHVGFDAPNVEAAARVAEGICTALGGIYLDPHYVCFSTGGDWAEQEEVWDRETA